MINLNHFFNDLTEVQKPPPARKEAPADLVSNVLRKFSNKLESVKTHFNALKDSQNIEFSQFVHLLFESEAVNFLVEEYVDKNGKVDWTKFYGSLNMEINKTNNPYGLK